MTPCGPMPVVANAIDRLRTFCAGSSHDKFAAAGPKCTPKYFVDAEIEMLDHLGNHSATVCFKNSASSDVNASAIGTKWHFEIWSVRGALTSGGVA